MPAVAYSDETSIGLSKVEQYNPPPRTCLSVPADDMSHTMTAKTLLMMCLVLSLVNNRGCQSSGEVAEKLARKFPEPSAAEQAELDEILARWQQNTAAFDSYRYEFRRWEYDPVRGPKDTCSAYSEGSICIVMPDRWHFQVDKTLKYHAPREAAESPSYCVGADWDNEEWSWDGEWLSEADYQRRIIVRTQMPRGPEPMLCPELPPPWLRPETEAGPWLVFGEPLRWLGRIDPQDLKRRYRLRLSPPNKVGDDHAIQAIPRSTSTPFPLNPVFTTIYLDRESCLPKAEVLHWSVAAAPNEQEARTVFQFTQADARVAEDDGFVVPQVEKREGWTLQVDPCISLAPTPLRAESEHHHEPTSSI